MLRKFVQTRLNGIALARVAMPIDIGLDNADSGHHTTAGQPEMPEAALRDLRSSAQLQI